MKYENRCFFIVILGVNFSISNKKQAENIDWFQMCLYIITLLSDHRTLNVLPVNIQQRAGPWFNIKMSSYQYRKSHCGDKTILRPSYLHNGISYTGKIISLYWIRAQIGNHNRPSPSSIISIRRIGSTSQHVYRAQWVGISYFSCSVR